MKSPDEGGLYRSLLCICAVYFLGVACAHQAGVKLPLLFVFYNIPSERYQDLIISFLSFGWAMLFVIGFLDRELKAAIQLPLLLSGAAALAGLIRAARELPFHGEVVLEITGLALLLFCLLAAYGIAIKGKRNRR